ncbi:MAG: 2,5-diamino-6-(ribosylamino)-4(3H)-pyrimidinone 5'-phosphate reductase [Halobacteria archaeon]
MLDRALRPFVYINAAMSADGKISTAERKQIRISSREDLDRVDELRGNMDAIMIGIGTVLADNPSLTVKSKMRRERRIKQGREENPVRVIVDSAARTPVEAEVLKKGEGKRIIAVSKIAPKARVERLSKAAEIITAGDKEVDLQERLMELKKRGIDKLMVEGGGTLNWSLISLGLVDEIYVYIAGLIIGGKTAPTLVDGMGFLKLEDMPKLELIECKPMNNGVFLKWRVLNT